MSVGIDHFVLSHASLAFMESINLISVAPPPFHRHFRMEQRRAVLPIAEYEFRPMGSSRLIGE